MPKKNTAERRAAVLQSIESLGVWNVPISTLAVEHGVTRKTIYKDIQKLIENMPKDSIDIICKGIQIGYKKALAKAMQIMVNPESSKKEQLMAARTVGFLGESFTRMLEAYGIKEKVADKFEDVSREPRKLIVEIKDAKEVIGKEDKHNSGTTVEKRGYHEQN